MNNNGQALVELLITMAIAGIVATAGVEGFVASRESYLRTSRYSEASAIFNEQLEALRSIRDRSWVEMAVNGTYHAAVSGSAWVLAAGAETGCDLCRQIVIANVCRDGSETIVDCPSGTVDPSTKKITVTVSWASASGGTVEQTIYLTRHPGNATWIETTRSDFNRGTTTNTITTTDDGGTVELDEGDPQSNTYDWPFTTAGNYTYDSNKIEVTDGVARLKATEISDSGNTLNSDLDSTADNWIYFDWDQGGGEVDATGTWQSAGGNPNGYVDVNIPAGKSDELGGFWEQSFTTTVNNPPTATVSFDWRVLNCDAAEPPNTFKAFVFVDPTSGAPTVGQEVWSSGEISTTSSWTSVSSVDVSSKLGAAGTYYLKLAIWIETPGGAVNSGPFTAGFDNAYLHWEGTGTSYPTDRPTINPTASLIVSDLTSWDGLTETATKNGGEVYYQLSDDNGTTWYYWVDPPTRDWIVAGNGNYNTASEVNDRIDEFPTTAGKIMFKAFLESDGSQLVTLDNVRVGYTTSAAYYTSGTFESRTFNAGANVGFNYLTWISAEPSGTDIRFQIATNSDDSTWNYVGSDGTGGTYFEAAGAVPLGIVSAQYIRYKAYLTGDGDQTPVLEDVAINYSP
jgi:hypothetical protein